MSLNGTTNTFVPYTLNGISNLATSGDITSSIASCVKYNGNTSNTDLNGYNLTTEGQINAGAIRITSSISHQDYSLSVNSSDVLEITNIFTNNKLKTDGNSIIIPGNNYTSGITYSSDLQLSGTSYLLYGTIFQWGQTVPVADYEIQDDTGQMQLRLSKTTGLTVSTLNLTATATGTPSYALGLNGTNQVIKYATASGTVNTSTTTARYLPYLSTATTLTNSLLYQIDNDNMGMGFTSLPSYPFSGSKNLYVDGSGFYAGLTSMVGTFGKNTNTSVPANEINFTANGSGILVSQIKSHSGSSAFYDATWTYSNTTAAPLGSNQGQVQLQADKLTLSLTSGLTVAGNVSTTGTNRFIQPYNALTTDVSTLVNRATLDSAVASVNLLPLNNIWTGNNTFNENVYVAGLGKVLSIQYGTFVKQASSGTAGSYTQIFGGSATNSPYMEWYFGGNPKGYIGYATATTLDFVADSGVNLTLGAGGSGRMQITSGGDITTSAGKFIMNSCIAGINSGSSYAISVGYMGTGSLTIGDITKNYGGGSGWNSNTAGVLLECLNGTEIAVHDAWDRVASLIYYSGNTIYLGRDMGWGTSYVVMPGGLNVSGGAIDCANQPFCIVGGVGGASIPYSATGATFGQGSYLYAYTSAGMSNLGFNGWNASLGRFYLVKTGRWQVNWSFYWNNFSAGSRAVLLHYNSGGGLLETRYCALNGGGIGADTTQAYSSLIYGSSGDYLQCQFQSGSGTLYFGGITHTHCTFHFLA